MNPMAIRALHYVKNSGGGATLMNFIEDHAPVGQTLWEEISEYVIIDGSGGRLYLNSDGAKIVAENEE